MITSERQQQILDILLESRSATVAEMSELFRVSAVTIRNDLNALAEQGRVVRTRGGAALAGGMLH